MKKFLAILLAFVMVLSLCACGAKTEAPAEAPAETPAEAPAEAPATVGLWDAYPETVTITTILPQNSAINFPEGEDYDNNSWYQGYLDEFNIQVKNLWVANDTAAYNTKLNLAMVSKDLPDVFAVDATQLQQLVEAGLIMELDEVWETYASDALKAYMDSAIETFETGKINGKLYGIAKMGWGDISQINQLWIRKDWKENLGLEDPKTIDDMVEIAKAFMAEYGGYGIAEDQGLESFNIIAAAWDAYPGIWVTQDDGTIGYGSVQPEVKEALAAYAEWYKEGILDPNFATTDWNKMCEGVYNNQVGVQPCYQWWGYGLGQTMVDTNGVDSIFQAYEIPSANGNTVKYPVKIDNQGYIVISKDCKNPDAALKLINYYVRMADAVEEDKDLAYVLFNDSMHNIPYSLSVLNPMSDYNQVVMVREAMETGDTSKLGNSILKYNNIIAFRDEGLSSAAGDYLQQGDPKAAYLVSKKAMDEGLLQRDAMWGTAPEALVNYGSTLNDILTVGFTQIITGEKPIEYFDELVQSWLDAGGAEVTTQINEKFGK